MKSFAELKLAAFQLMDEGSSQYLSDAEMGNYINAGFSELYETVLFEDPWRLQSETSIAPVAGVKDYALPNCRRVLRVQQVWPMARKIRMRQFNPSEYGSSPYSQCPRYCIINGKLRLDPTPTDLATWSMFVQFVPNATPLVADADQTPFYNLPPFEQWIINRAVIYAKLKEEVSVYDFEQQQAPLMMAIMNELRMGQDIGEGRHIVDDSVMGMGQYANPYWPY